MRFLISALFLALFGSRKDSKCSEEIRLTSSYIPAGVIVLDHYHTQIRGLLQHNERDLGVPNIEITYHDGSVEASKFARRLKILGLALIDEINKQNFEECLGFTSETVKELAGTSALTPSGQLSFILKKIGNEVKEPVTIVLVKGFLAEMKDPGSELSKGLESIKSMKFLED